MTAPESPADLLPCEELEPGVPVDAAVIWMHGLGADGNDFVPIVPHLGVEELGIRFVFPHAPVMPVSVNGGMRMPAWYDLYGVDSDTPPDLLGLATSALRVGQLVARERERGIAAERIVLAGFSQGGAVAQRVALRHGERLAGLVMLSTYIPELAVDDGAGLQEELADANRGLEVFAAHGTADMMVSEDRGQLARLRLERFGHPVEWHEYPMGHEVCLEEIEALGRWLRARLG